MIRQRRVAVRAAAYASFVACMLLCSSARSETLIPRQHHEWGRFPNGSWKKVRLVTEKLDRKGQVISSNISETTTTVVAHHQDAVELRLETVVKVAGKQFKRDPQVFTQNFGGEVESKPEATESRVEHIGKDSVVIDGKKLESDVKTITVRRERSRWTSRIHYCRSVAPYVLRREIRSQDPSGGATRYRTTVEVTALDMPLEVRGELRPTSHVRTVHTTPKGKTITLEVRCEDVPGGFVSHTSKQLDSAGRLVGRSTLELVDFDVPEQAARSTTSPRRIWSRWGLRRAGQ